MTTPLTINNFENALSQLGRLAMNLKPPQPVNHVVLNCHKSLAEAVDSIQAEIRKSQPNQLLHSLDLRTIFIPQGDPNKWRLEAVSTSQSLCSVGDLPTS